MRKIENGQYQALIHYIELEPQYNIYMLGDLLMFGLEDQNVSFYTDDTFSYVLMKYFNSFVLYSFNNFFDAYDIYLFLRTQKKNRFSCITGKQETLKKLSPYLKDYAKRETYILEKDLDVDLDMDLCQEEICKECSKEELLRFYLNIAEMQDKYSTYDEKSLMEIDCFLKTGRGYAVKRNNEIISSVATTAESEKYAMIINVATKKEYRNQKYIQHLLHELARDMRKIGKKKLFVYYENEIAGKVYRKAGFADAGIYQRIALV